MNVARALLTGFVEVRAKPAAEGGAHRVLTLAEKPGVATTLWKVVLATPEADAEAGELAEGEAVAFAGAVIHGRSREGVALRSLTADRALALSTPAVSSPKLDEADHVTGDQIREMFRQVESHSQILGAAAERWRVKSIMNAHDAAGRQALAWRLAEAGLTVPEAIEALRIAKLESAFLPVDLGRSLTH